MIKRHYRKVGSKGTVTIPVELRRRLSLEGKTVRISINDNGDLELKPFARVCMVCEYDQQLVTRRGITLCPLCVMGFAKENADAGN